MSLNAHKGRPEVLTDWMDASVVDEFDPTRTDPRARSVQPGQRAALLTCVHRPLPRRPARPQPAHHRLGKAELARVNAAGVPDILFPLYRTWADLRFMDPAIDPSDRPCPAAIAASRPT